MSHMKKIAASAVTLVMVASAMPVTSFAATYYNQWVQKSDGKWYYYDYYGKKVKYDSRQYYDSETGAYIYYVLNIKGARVTSKGWYTTKYRYNSYYSKTKFTTKYYLKSDGACTIGWKKIKGKYYYFDTDGKLLTATSVKSTDGTKLYLVGNDGARITKKGWYQVKYKYFRSSESKVYTEKCWYFVKTDKTVATGVKKIGGKKYLFNDDGILVQNNIAIFHNEDYSKYTYYAADKNGKLITKKGKRTISASFKYEGLNYKDEYKVKATIYVKSGGKLLCGLKKISGKYYYFDPTMIRCGSRDVNGVRYFFGRSGACTKTVDLVT